MPTAKERKQDNKIKSQRSRVSGRPVRQEARRVMTAKLKKELAQQKRGGSSATERPCGDSAATEAVDKAEQTAGAAVHETGRQIKRDFSRAVTKAKKDRQQIKERQEQPGNQKHPTDTPALDTPERPGPEIVPQEHTPREAPRIQPGPAPQEAAAMTARTTMPRVRPDDRPPSQPGPKIHPTGPTPGDRMLRQAVDARKEQARRPERTITAPASGGPPTTGHYGRPAAPSSTPTAPKDDLSPQTPSIYIHPSRSDPGAPSA